MATRAILAIAPVASLLLAQGAHAQSGACEQLKATLAARIDPSIRGYSLEAVSADTPVPRGAKVIGTCEGGARKILFRRSGSSESSADAASAAQPASAPQISDVPKEALKKPSRASALNRASAPAVAASTTSISEPSSASISSEPGVPTVNAVAAQPLPQLPPPQAQRDMVARASSVPSGPDFVDRYWPWLAALGLAMLAGALSAWLTHRNTYDSAGLPRGPRLK